jgi:V/A-type H+-transporting ATPase subunit E
MAGLDNIVSEILAEANAAAESVRQAAQREAEEIAKAAAAQSRQECEALEAKAGQARDTEAARTKSSADLQRRQRLLAAKQEIIAGVIDNAYAEIFRLDDAAYFELVKKMLGQYVLDKEGEICFNERDKKRLPKDFGDVIGEAAKAKGGSLVLSDEVRKIDGGFVLIYGGIEENCSFEALFAAERDRLTDRVYQFVFA